MTRPDGRAANELRPLTFQRDFTEMAAGSVLVSLATHVCCAQLRSMKMFHVG